MSLFLSIYVKLTSHHYISALLQMIQRVSATGVLRRDPFKNPVSNQVGKKVLEELERRGMRTLNEYTGQEILAATMTKLDRSPPAISSEVNSLSLSLITKRYQPKTYPTHTDSKRCFGDSCKLQRCK